MPLASPIRVCASCATAGAKKKCSVCMSAWYCNGECQKRHWKAGHKKACPKLQSLRQQREELELARSTSSTPATVVLGASSEAPAGGDGGVAAAGTPTATSVHQK